MVGPRSPLARVTSCRGLACPTRPGSRPSVQPTASKGETRHSLHPQKVTASPHGGAVLHLPDSCVRRHGPAPPGCHHLQTVAPWLFSLPLTSHDPLALLLSLDRADHAGSPSLPPVASHGVLKE